MGTGILTRYSASAGSGKTFSLTAIYLSKIFREKESYKKILAVTFTNKATAEMKSRILEQLHLLSSQSKSEYLKGLINDTGLTESEIRSGAGELLNTILHDFSRFSVFTIDAFFQKILRAFARESGLHSGYNVEIDHNKILLAAIDEMIASSADDEELKDWLNAFVNSRLDDEKSWDPEKEIIKLAAEIFKERFRILSSGERERLEDKKFLLEYIDKIRSVKDGFEITLSDVGSKCLSLYDEFGLTDDMFFQKARGVPGYIRNLARGSIIEPNTYVKAILSDPPKWSSKSVQPALKSAINAGLEKILRDTISFYETNLINYNSSREILSNIYALGILSDILKKVRLIASDENSFLLSDSGEFLREITSGDQAPFIYEKIGNIYDNYMIDEFQDTSLMQWDNFFPLLDESMARGNDNLVVGDIKQSIYRFRNSDWQILGRLLNSQISEKRLRNVPLDLNWRSKSEIIRFNNTIFKIIPAYIDLKFKTDPDPVCFSDIYSEAIQKDPGNKKGGYIRIEFVENDYVDGVNKRGKESKIKSKRWEDKVLERVPLLIEQVQDMGYSASDIGIIVRYSHEGTAVLNTMIKYGNACSDEKKKKYNYKVVSDYSLTLSNSPAILFIISALRLFTNPDDDISRAAMLRYFLLATGYPDADKVSLGITELRSASPLYFPEGYNEFMKRTACQSIFEAVENLISFFNLGKHPWNIAYLNTFQDLVISFSSSKETDFQSFLDWWEISGSSKSVVLPADQDAAKIFTIHKAKGLEFRVVILPFLSWNDDHKTYHHEIVWVKPPDIEPFNELGIIPVRYRRNPPSTIFTESYRQEKYSAFLDNLNLLYVAMTRAKDAMFGFAAGMPDENNGISQLLKIALTSETNPAGESGLVPVKYFNGEQNVFETGRLDQFKKVITVRKDIPSDEYMVYPKPESLKLKLHGENYFLAKRDEVISRINYGKLMHHAFEYIDTLEDIPGAVSRLVNEGMIPGSESESMVHRLRQLVQSPAVKDWFAPGKKIIKEADILLPSGSTKRPDRVLPGDDRVIIIDFKFGEENKNYSEQIEEYCKLLTAMGYNNVEGYLWYVDRNKIVKI
jgi:ATP-dependent helicase/nuclease subunit A